MKKNTLKKIVALALVVFILPIFQLAAFAVDTEKPTAPTNLRLSGRSGNDITLAWNASTDNVGVASYYVFASVFDGTNTVFEHIATVPGNTLQASYQMTLDRRYVFYVEAIDTSSNVSDPSNGKVFINNFTPPTTPTNLTTSNLINSSVTLSWNASTTLFGLDCYNIYDNGNFIAYTTGTSYTLYDLASGSHSFYIVAVAAGQNGMYAASNQSNTASIGFIPGTIEAEHYASGSGVGIEICNEGGQDVTSINTYDYMDYNLYVKTAGSYTVQFRVASNVSTSKLDLKEGPNTYFSNIVPNTGSMQSWTTISGTLNLSAGNHTLRVYGAVGGFSLNWMSFTKI